MTLSSEIVIVPPETLLIAAPLPPPEPLPVNVEPLISTRPYGRSVEVRRLGRPRVVVQVGVVETAAGLLGVVVLDRDAVEGQLAERPVLDRAALLGAEAVLERDVPERDVAGPGVDLEETVEPAGDDGRARQRLAAVDDDVAEVARRLLDRHRVEDLEVADVGGVLVDRRDPIA